MKQRSEVTGQTAARQIGEANRKIQGIKTYQNRNPEAEISVGTITKVGKFKLQLMNCCKFNVDKSES